MADYNEDKPAHLRKLPIKSFDVAPGDVVGGMVFVMDKPLGIEEGMVGISVDSVPYRAFIAEQLMSLIKGNNDNKELQARFNKKITEDSNFRGLIDSVKQHQDNLLAADTKHVDKLITAMMSDKKHVTKRHPPSWDEAKKVFTTFGELGTIKGLTTYKVNTGMGGLLFEGYKTDCGVTPGSKFYVEIGKLMAKGDKAYMVKQDGELILGGTGPSLTKILKTTMGKTYLQPLMNPLVVIGTGGLSAVAFGIGAAAWKGYYLRNNNPVKANSDAIVETISTKMAKAKGFAAQEIDTIEGTYDKNDNKPKIATIVTWSPGCVDLGGRVTGDESNLGSVAVSYNDDGIRIKTDKNGNIFQGFEKKLENGAKAIDAKGQPIIEYFKIDPNNNKKTAITEQDYNNAPYTVSDDKIYGMGESLASFIGSGDTDGIGSKGQNKAIVPLDKSKNYGSNYTHQFYGIDFGKAYNQNPSPIVGSLRDDFSFEKPSDATLKFSNYSMLYDNPLSDKMKGIYLLAALRGQLTDPRKSEIATEYQKSDPVFAAKLKTYPEPTPGKNSDLALIQKEIEHYEKLAQDAGKNKKKKSEYTSYADRLKEVKKTAQETDNQILKVFESRIKLNPAQIDVLDNIEKLTAKKASVISADGKVILNHVQVIREDRIAWQITPPAKEGDKFLLYSEANKADHSEILNKLNKYAENSDLKDIIQKIKLNDATGKIEAALTSDEVKLLSEKLTETSVVAARKGDDKFIGAELYRTQEQKDAFHNALKQASVQKPAETESNRLNDKLSSILEIDNLEAPKKSTRLNQSGESLFTVEEASPRKRSSIGALGKGDPLEDFERRSTSVRSAGIISGDINKNTSFTPSRSGPPRTLAVIQDASFKELVTYFKNGDIKTNHPNIKNAEQLKNMDIPSSVVDIQDRSKRITVNLNKPGDASDQTIDVTISQAMNTGQVQYYAPKHLSEDDFKFTAAEICKLAVLSSKAGAKFDFSKASPEKQVILKQEFEKAVQEAISNKKFTKETAPSLKESSSAKPAVSSPTKPKRPGSASF